MHEPHTMKDPNRGGEHDRETVEMASLKREGHTIEKRLVGVGAVADAVELFPLTSAVRALVRAIRILTWVLAFLGSVGLGGLLRWLVG